MEFFARDGQADTEQQISTDQQKQGCHVNWPGACQTA